MVTLAEKFLVHCICTDENVNTFCQTRNMVYYKKSKKLDLERFPPTSSSIFLHIKRAYLQSYVWLRSPCAKNLVIDPLEYGYKLQEDDDAELMKLNIETISLAWGSTNTVQVWKVCKSKCIHLPCEQYTMLSVLQLQSWNMPKFFELILFILGIYVRFIWLHELLFFDQNSTNRYFSFLKQSK